jgi:Homeodomain-like domain
VHLDADRTAILELVHKRDEVPPSVHIWSNESSQEFSRDCRYFGKRQIHLPEQIGMNKTARKQNGIYVGTPSANGVKRITQESVSCPDAESDHVDHGVNDNAKKARAVALLASGTSVSEVARTLGVHRTTIHRWFSDPCFSDELARQRDGLIEQTFDLQVFASLQATRKLLELLDSEDPRIAFWSARTLAPLKEAYVLMDHERRVRSMENIVAESSYG